MRGALFARDARQPRYVQDRILASLQQRACEGLELLTSDIVPRRIEKRFYVCQLIQIVIDPFLQERRLIVRAIEEGLRESALFRLEEQISDHGGRCRTDCRNGDGGDKIAKRYESGLNVAFDSGFGLDVDRASVMAPHAWLGLIVCYRRVP